MVIQHLRNRKSFLEPRAMRGFTLLEMAMVLGIIGLIMGTILSMTKTLTTSSKISATQSKEALIKAALINFIATNNRLPCPADPTGALAALGTETINTTTTPKSCNTNTSVTANPTAITQYSNSVYAGVVPWATLGLTQDAATDGYNQYFTYLVAATAIQTVSVAALNSIPTAILNAGLVPTISGLKGAISIYSLGTAGNQTLANQINNCMPSTYFSTTPYNPCSAVVVIISHGADGLGAYTSNGPASLLPYADEQLNASHTNQIVMHDFSMSVSNPFDDIILPMTSSDLLSPLTANGTIQPYNAVLNIDFANINAAIATALISTRMPVGTGPYTYNTMNYNSLSTANSTATATPASTTVFSNLPNSIIYDPWGNKINFIMPVAPIVPPTMVTCFGTLPSTTLYFLSSFGPDGIQNGTPQAPTGDDINLTVNFSQFQPLFQNSGGGC